MQCLSLRTAEAFRVVASLPPKSEEEIQNFAKSSRLPPSPPLLGHTLNPSRYTPCLPFLGPSKVEENFRHAYSIPTRLTKLKPTFF